MQSFPAQITIGSIAIAPATVLAPMAGVTDTVFRRFIRNLGGCGLIMTEFTSSHGVSAASNARKPTRTLKYLAFEPEEHPISAQLFGADPAVMADAARVCQDLGFDILDINFGCPVSKVVKCNGGSGLLRDLPLVERLLREVRKAITIPFTMKFRAGWNDRELVTVRMAQLAENCGLQAIALHPRTREQIAHDVLVRATGRRDRLDRAHRDPGGRACALAHAGAGLHRQQHVHARRRHRRPLQR